jgi:predicted nucleic acid-binding protein
VSRIFWDTNLFIYLFEGTGTLAQQVAGLRRRMVERRDQLLTSTMTLGEVLVKPLQMGQQKTADYYRKLMTSSAAIVPFDESAAVIYARLRGDRSLRPPDAIQLACASSAGVDLFITNDRNLHTKQIPGIQFIASLERAPI